MISNQAAAAIWARLRVVPGALDPATLIDLPDEVLRAPGLSRPKVAHAKALAAAFLDGTLSETRIAALDDEDAVLAIASVKGMGRWTAESTCCSPWAAGHFPQWRHRVGRGAGGPEEAAGATGAERPAPHGGGLGAGAVPGRAAAVAPLAAYHRSPRHGRFPGGVTGARLPRRDRHPMSTPACCQSRRSLPLSPLTARNAAMRSTWRCGAICPTR